MTGLFGGEHEREIKKFETGFDRLLGGSACFL